MTNASPQRWRYSSGGLWEDEFGYSRAIRTGDHIAVSGCTAVLNGVLQHPGDAAGQMGVALDSLLGALAELGGAPGDVIRTRVYVVNRVDCAAVGKVHGERFADVRPAATMGLVAGLLDEEMLVEVECEARVGSANPYYPPRTARE
jgi:enamine deaminase RidA (YjgF/YER057c/UK114 family)